MENKQQYRSTIKSRPYFYMETKKLAELVLQGFNEIELKKQVVENNIFQVKTDARKREIASVILQRLKVLDDYLINQLNISDIGTSKLIVLYTIIKTDRLFYEFMNEVFSDKIAYRDLSLTDRDFNIFFEGKRQQSEIVAKWKEYTFYKIQQVYIRILFEAGMLKNQKGNREILVPVANPDVLEHIRNTDDPRFINLIVGGTSV
ncbi:DUF1819 family protein [Oceanobacillus manasiensis]|uniref:DUF1819 family protein n=1 Tax=Oceanobacillus manasiensis TaxID=586413 RepID=UPI0018DE80F8|nr:DUF1819 family protein [Oceanobacillus manasiensis]